MRFICPRNRWQMKSLARSSRKRSHARTLTLPFLPNDANHRSLDEGRQRRLGTGRGCVRVLKRGIFVLVVMAATAVGLAQDLPKAVDSRSGIPFEANRDFGSILIRAKVNGQPATLIVDTGSSHTMLSSELLHVRPLALPRAAAPTKGSGYVGTASWAKAHLEIGRDRWEDRSVLVMNDFQEMSNSLKQKVDGIVGEDVLREFDAVVIDFKHKKLFLLY